MICRIANPVVKQSVLRCSPFLARVMVAQILFVGLLVGVGLCFAQSAPPKTGADTFDSLAQRADAARDSDRLDEAVVLYKKALAVRPKWEEGWWSLGTIEYDRNNYRAAASAFRQLLPLTPKDGTVYAMLGLSEFELGRDDAALRHLEEARRLQVSTNSQLRLVMLYHDGILLLRTRKYQSAETSLGALCRDEVPNDDVVKALGLAVFRLASKEAPAEGTPGAPVVQRVGHAACISVQKKYDEARKEYADLLAEIRSTRICIMCLGSFWRKPTIRLGQWPNSRRKLKAIRRTSIHGWRSPPRSTK